MLPDSQQWTAKMASPALVVPCLPAQGCADPEQQTLAAIQECSHHLLSAAFLLRDQPGPNQPGLMGCCPGLGVPRPRSCCRRSGRSTWLLSRSHLCSFHLAAVVGYLAHRGQLILLGAR